MGIVLTHGTDVEPGISVRARISFIAPEVMGTTTVFH